MRRANYEDSRKSLRAAAKLRRGGLTPSDRCVRSGAIQTAALALNEYQEARAVALYSPVQNEVDTSAILSDALASRKKVFYPKLGLAGVTGFARISAPADLASGPYGILEPAGDEALAPDAGEPLIVFVPGLLFDRQGSRLGRGGGWYDRALRELGQWGFFAGLAYDFQLVEALPAQSWDQRVHVVITEKGRIDCRQLRH
jgi:5-formyltetrahydrofolate cyclo-ligase